jgi:hypothetical protein
MTEHELRLIENLVITGMPGAITSGELAQLVAEVRRLRAFATAMAESASAHVRDSANAVLADGEKAYASRCGSCGGD